MHINGKNRILALLLALMLLLSACGGAKSEPSQSAASTSVSSAEAPTVTVSISQDTKFDAAILSLSQAEFDGAGFAFGDACELVFSNGLTISDVPYYNGYYTKSGDPVLVAYPNTDSVLVTRNNRGIWTDEGFDDSTTVTVTRTDEGKYLATQEALGQSYSVERSDYDSDTRFANFRAMSGGALRADFLYRGASPVDNGYGRAAYVDALLEENGIVTVLDLADSETEMQGYFAKDDFASDYTAALFTSGNDICLSMSSDYSAESYRTSLAAGLRHLLANGGPAYIHCKEGKDRTGFVCLVLEALCGAGYDELCGDYMTTYSNYYGITAEETPERYAAVVSLYFDSFIEYLTGETDVDAMRAYNMEDAARTYLSSCGLSDEEIDSLHDMLCR